MNEQLLRLCLLGLMTLAPPYAKAATALKAPDCTIEKASSPKLTAKRKQQIVTACRGLVTKAHGLASESNGSEQDSTRAIGVARTLFSGLFQSEAAKSHALEKFDAILKGFDARHDSDGVEAAYSLLELAERMLKSETEKMAALGFDDLNERLNGSSPTGTLSYEERFKIELGKSLDRYK